MIIGKTEGSTREIGAPRGWDQDKVRCSALHVLDIVQDGNSVMVSEWIPTAEELALLRAGRPVRLFVWGSSHPPVALEVQP